MSKSLKKLIDINRLREFKNKLVGTGSAYVQTSAVDQTIAGTKTFSKPIVGSVTGSSGSCTGNAATATRATSADKATNADHATKADSATKATQDSDGNKITTTYSKNGHTHDDRYYTENEVNNLLNGKANTSGTYSNLTVGNAGSATNATYANWLRTSSHSDHLFHTEWDNAGYFWTYVTTGKGDYRAVRVARSDSSGKADTATKATQDAAGNTITTTYATKAQNNTKANNSEVVHKSGDETVNGSKTFTSEIVNTSVHAFRHIFGDYGVFWRHDNTNLYLMLTNSGDQYGGWNNFRPLVVNLATGICSINGNANSAGSAGSATNATYANWLRTSSHSDHLFHTEWDNAGYFWTYVTAGDGGYRAVRVARSDSAASADRASIAGCVQTSDYHEIRFDWDSQVSGCVGLRVDVTDMGGIVTTNRLVSDIRAQWYAAYPDGAEAHNAMWGGRDITAAFNNGTVSANIANGTFKDIFPGDYITKSVTISGKTYTVNWVIADCDYWINKGDQGSGMTTHHVVIVPQAPIFNAQMNSTNTTEGGYAGSEMYKKIIPACAAGIVSAFGSDHILTFRDVICNSLDASNISSGITQWTGTPGWVGEWVSVQCNLMSEMMVYGAPICSAGAMDNTIAPRQMSAFRLSEKLINYNRQWWWLRNVACNGISAIVRGVGDAGAEYVTTSFYVRPFALLR